MHTVTYRKLFNCLMFYSLAIRSVCHQLKQTAQESAEDKTPSS